MLAMNLKGGFVNKLCCIIWEHRHGTNIYHVLAKNQAAAEKIVLKIIKAAGDEYEPDRESLACYTGIELDYPNTHELVVQKKPKSHQGGTR